MTNRAISYQRFITALLALILAGVNVYAVKTFDVLSSPVLFTTSVLGEMILLVIALFYAVMGLAVRGNIVKSVALSAWGGINKDSNVKKLRRTKSRFLRFTGRRLEIARPFGLPLTLVCVIAGYFLYHFIQLLLGIVFEKQVIQIDLRIVNLVPSIRTSMQTTLFSFVTFLANIEAVLFLLLLSTVILWIRRQRLLIAILVGMAVVEEACTFVLKVLIDRHRPDIALSLIDEQSRSFPSGHVMRATVLFGVVAYLLFKSSTSTFSKLLVILGYVTTVFLVALSRVYLGVHYPSDVLGSLFFGAFLLTCMIGAIEIGTRYKLPAFKQLQFENRLLWVVPAALAVLSLLVGPSMLGLRTVPSSITLTQLPRIDQTTVQRLPLYSESLTGSHMEPISFIYAGSEAQIMDAFIVRGWFRADASTISNTLRAVSVGFQGGQYETAPVTPSYLNAQPENLAFEKPTETNTLRQRHHTRIWKTNFVVADGRPIWVATASYDQGVQLAGTSKLPTHHIDPNIDGERMYIVQSLGLRATYLEVVKPQLGKNASGDAFFTDGRAAVITL